ncbi:MAG: cyclic-di-AMP receptor [Bacillota bacterium]
MKMVIIVVQDQDVHKLLNLLLEKGYSATKLASTGGFLREGNTTLLMGVRDDKVGEVTEIIRQTCQTRKQMMTPVSYLGRPFLAEPVEVTVGGATVFVLPVEEFVKV